MFVITLVALIASSFQEVKANTISFTFSLTRAASSAFSFTLTRTAASGVRAIFSALSLASAGGFGSTT